MTFAISKFMKALPILPITYVLKTAKLLKISTRFFYSFRLQKVGVLQRLNPQWIMKSCHDVLGTIRTSFTKLRWRGKKIPVHKYFCTYKPQYLQSFPQYLQSFLTRRFFRNAKRMIRKKFRKIEDSYLQFAKKKSSF